MMSKQLLTLSLFLVFLVSSLVGQKNKWTTYRPDGLAPLFVSNGHFHRKGELFVGTSFAHHHMQDHRIGFRSVSLDEIFENYFTNNGGEYGQGYYYHDIVPISMRWNTIQLQAKYGLTNGVTLAVSVPLKFNTMELVFVDQSVYNSNSNGIGDISFTFTGRLLNQYHHAITASLEVFLPTGSITKTLEVRERTYLHPYAMQLGSGSIDPKIGFTYLGQSKRLSWGLQTNGLFRGWDNSLEYRLGYYLENNAWFAFRATDRISFSSSVTYFINGEAESPRTYVDPYRRIFKNQFIGFSPHQLNVGVGTNVYVPISESQSVRIRLEIVRPITQRGGALGVTNKWNGGLGLYYVMGEQRRKRRRSSRRK